MVTCLRHRITQREAHFSWSRICRAALAVLFICTAFARAESSDLPQRKLWVDSINGNDANDGTLEHPLASFLALNQIAHSWDPFYFDVQLSPGVYPVDNFVFSAESLWSFRRCMECPLGAARGEVYIQPIPTTSLLHNNFIVRSFGYLLPHETIKRPLTFANITFEPLKASQFKPESLDGTGNVAEETVPDRVEYIGTIFAVAPVGLSMDNCVLSGFVMANSAIITGGNSLQLHNCVFRGNSLIKASESSAKSLFGDYDIVKDAPCVIEGTEIVENSVESGWIYGGLFAIAGNCNISKSFFRDNSGQVEESGNGLIFLIGGNRRETTLEISGCYFTRNTFTGLHPLTSLVSASINSSTMVTTTMGAAIGIRRASTGLHLSIRQTHFQSNTADQGSCLSNMRIAHYSDDPISTPSSYLIHDVTFEDNRAEYGLGAAIYLADLPDKTTIRFTDVTFLQNFASLRSYYLFEKTYAARVRLDDATLVTLTDFQGTIEMNRVAVDGSSGHPHRPSIYPNAPDLHQIHRIQVKRCENFKTDELTFRRAIPSLGTGSYLQISNVGSTFINNTALQHFPPAPPDSPFISLPWNLISVVADRIPMPEAQFMLNQLSIFNWKHVHDTTILLAHGLQQIFLKSVDIQDITSTESLPLLVCFDVTALRISDSHFYGIANALQLSDVGILNISGSSLSFYSSSVAAVRVSNVKQLIINDLSCQFSTATFLSINQVSATQIYNSSFTKAVMTTSSGAITWRGTQFGTLLLSNVSIVANSAQSGPALFIDGEAEVSITNSKLNDNQAASSGGAISIRGCRQLFVNHTIFNHNTASTSGGAIDTDCPLNLFYTSFTVNSAFVNAGGAISAQLVPGLNFTIDHCTFTGNVANVLGGAVYYSYTSSVAISPSYIVIKNSNFIRNHVSPNNKDACGGALTTHCPFDTQSTAFMDNIANGGGAICYLDPEQTETASPVIIANSSFVQNNATQLGGAILINGIFSAYPAPWNARLDENLFQSNSAESGGAIASIGPQFDLNNTKIPNTFVNNRARVGGAFYMRSSSQLLEIGNQRLWSNDAIVAGGVIFYEILTNLEAVPDSSYMCKVAECFNNTATAWGPLSATQSLDLTVHYPADLKKNLNSLVLYPGVEKVIVIEATDQFGQHIDLIPEAYRIQTDLSPGHQPNGRYLRLHSTRILNQAAALKLVIQLDGLSAMLSEPITASIKLLITMESLYHVNKATILPILVEACGPGYGQDASNPSQCSTCSWMYYSLNGTCSSCAYDSSNNRTNSYQSIRCPSGFCKGKNECVPGRTGPLCGQCVPGTHESIFTTCTSCNKPNWALITAAILVLWVVVLIFHSIISVSSGKSSILIFFLSTSFTITYQIPIVDVFSSGGNQVRVFSIPRSLEPFICLFPMNLLERTLLTAMVPFFMMVLITLTFTIHRIIWVIYKLVKRSRGGYPAVPASEFSLLSRPTNASTEAVASSDPSKPSSEYGYEVSDYDNVVSSDESQEDVGDQRGAPYEGAQETYELSAEPSPASPLGSSGDDALGFDDEETDVLMSENKHSAFFRELEEKYRWQIENRFFHHYRLIRTLLTLFAATFSLILGTVMTTSGCITLNDGNRVLQTAPGISCDSKYFKMWRILYAVFLPYLALVLAALLGKLISAYLKNELSQTDVRFGSWYEMFKPNLFAWKVVEMIRRICILCVGQLLLSDPPKRASLLAIIMIGFLTLHLIAMPYRQKLENGLESLSLATLSVVSLLVYWHSRQRIPYRLSAIFAWSLVILTALLIISGFAAHKLSSSGGFWRKIFRFFSPK